MFMEACRHACIHVYICLQYNVCACFSVLFLPQASYIISKFNLCAFDHNNIIILKRTVCINLISCNIIDYIIYKGIIRTQLMYIMHAYICTLCGCTTIKIDQVRKHYTRSLYIAAMACICISCHTKASPLAVQ